MRLAVMFLLFEPGFNAQQVPSAQSQQNRRNKPSVEVKTEALISIRFERPAWHKCIVAGENVPVAQPLDSFRDEQNLSVQFDLPAEIHCISLHHSS